MDFLRELSAASWPMYVAEAAGLGLVLLISTIVNRRFFHPLAKIPGPFLASITHFPIWYHSVFRESQYPFQIAKMHEKYGPIVRISPREIHLSDPDDYDTVYSSYSLKFRKDYDFYSTLPFDGMFNTISNDLHKSRRALLAPFFSRRSVLMLEDIVHAKAEKLARRVREAAESNVPLDMDAGMRAISVDVITEYAFDNCWDHLDCPDFGSWFSVATRGSGVMWYNFHQFPFLVPVLGALPEWLARVMNPPMKNWFDCIHATRDMVAKVCRDFDAGIKPGRRSIFHELLDPVTVEKDAKSEPPSIDYMCQEALSFCMAAAETTGNAMSTSAYHVVTTPYIYNRLMKELLDAFPDQNAKMGLSALEKLPYLTGAIKEGMRLSYGVISRLPRQAGEGGATFQGYHVPAGTTVSMSSYMQHRNPTAFPDPDVFDPTRWIGADPEASRLRDRCLVTFSRGSRMCLGQNLAMSELYITLAVLFRRLADCRLAAFDVGPEDRILVDCFNAFHPKGARPFKVVAAKE